MIKKMWQREVFFIKLGNKYNDWCPSGVEKCEYASVILSETLVSAFVNFDFHTIIIVYFANSEDK